MSSDLKKLWSLGLLALILILPAALARPSLSEEELEVLEEDLQDFEDARAVDEAYARLFAVGGRPPSAPRAPSEPLHDDDYDGELPQGDQPLPDDDRMQADESSAPSEPLRHDLPRGLLDVYDGELPQGDQPLPDDDRMQADEPVSEETMPTSFNLANANVSTSTSENNSSNDQGSGSGTVPSAQQMEQREILENAIVESAKEWHLNVIKNQVLQLLNLPANHSSADTEQVSVIRKVTGRINLPGLLAQDFLAEKMQSQYPTCSVPRNTDEELWAAGNAMHLLFELPPSPPGRTGYVDHVVEAKLRLFKRGNQTTVPSTAMSPCGLAHGAHGAHAGLPGPAATASASLGSDSVASSGGAPASFPGMPEDSLLLGMSPVEDRKVRVSVYWYTRSLKKNRMKRKLLDSSMVSVHGAHWTEWDVRQAVRTWRDSGRNFGLAIEVEDEDGVLLPAHQFFTAMNCTQEASTARPLPSVILPRAALRLYHGHASGHGAHGAGLSSAAGSESLAFALNQNMFPVIDLVTAATSDGLDNGAVVYDMDETSSSSGSTSERTHAHAAEAAPQHRLQHKHRHRHNQDQQHGRNVEEEADPPAGRRRPRDRVFDPRNYITEKHIVIPKELVMDGLWQRLRGSDTSR